MDTNPVIIVQISDREWTLEALHCACLMARISAGRIVLVQMIPVQHPAWLGTELGSMNFTHGEQAEFDDYQATIEDYGLEFTPLLFQYESLVEAIVQAAEYVNAQVSLRTYRKGISRSGQDFSSGHSIGSSRIKTANGFRSRSTAVML